MNNLKNIQLVKMKIFSYVVGDILRSIRGNALMGAFIQSFCLIDYLASIASFSKDPSKKGDNYYQAFIRNYLKNYDDKKLYAIRCGLVHTYGQSNRMKRSNLDGCIFQHKNPENHRKYINNIYWLNLSNFVFDIIKSTYQFFTDLEQKQDNNLYDYKERAKNVISVFKSLEISVSPNYGNIDPILSYLDADNINWEILKNEIYKLCLTK